MNPQPCSDVSANDRIVITQTWHVFHCTALPREPEYLIDGKNEVRHLDAGRVQKPYSSLSSVSILVIVRYFRSVKFPHIEFKQSLARPRFAALNLINSLFNRMTSVYQNDST